MGCAVWFVLLRGNAFVCGFGVPWVLPGLFGCGLVFREFIFVCFAVLFVYD